MHDFTIEEYRQNLLLHKENSAENWARLEEIDAMTGLLSSQDLKRLEELKDHYVNISAEDAKLSKYAKFVKYAEDIYCYVLAKYNSRTRANRVASIFLGAHISSAEVDEWATFDDTLASRLREATEAFKDKIREEIFQRAIIGETKPIFDREGNHIRDIVIKDNKLLEKMLSANCSEYKEKNTPAVLASGNIVFNVMNYAQEGQEEEENGDSSAIQSVLEHGRISQDGQSETIEVCCADVEQDSGVRTAPEEP